MKLWKYNGTFIRFMHYLLGKMPFRKYSEMD